MGEIFLSTHKEILRPFSPPEIVQLLLFHRDRMHLIPTILAVLRGLFDVVFVVQDWLTIVRMLTLIATQACRHHREHVGGYRCGQVLLVLRRWLTGHRQLHVAHDPTARATLRMELRQGRLGMW